MTYNENLEKVIKGLKCYTSFMQGEHNICKMEYCPYWNESGKWTLCNNFQMQLDALALLEEIKPRVVAFEEINNHEVLWVEMCGMNTEEGLAPWIKTRSGRWYSPLYCNESEPDMLLSTPEEYGIFCRAWTQRPSDEQREETEWQIL